MQMDSTHYWLALGAICAAWVCERHELTPGARLMIASYIPALNCPKVRRVR